uniref:Uncharacterized protein n=1 Tax=Romanomermis culicivorax TaxID=13658 RepID=A0A915HJ70_ROMCU
MYNTFDAVHCASQTCNGYGGNGDSNYRIKNNYRGNGNNYRNGGNRNYGNKSKIRKIEIIDKRHVKFVIEEHSTTQSRSPCCTCGQSCHETVHCRQP